MRNKILFCATVDFHFNAFHLPCMKWFKEQGWEVHVVASGNMELPFVDYKYNIPISRSPISSKNLQAYKQLKYIIEKNDYEIIHCHTPVGGVLSRLAAREARKKGTKVIYTAHGFHFCKGSPKINWMIYYPIERWLARFTDCLITINEEDYKLAVKHRFNARRIEHIHGVGVNTEEFSPISYEEKKELREKYGFSPGEFIMFYAAEFNKNKNQKLLIKSIALLKKEIPAIKLLLAGNGPTLGECKKIALNLGIADSINFLGFREDIEQLLKISDAAVASSLREGLPVNIMEAMSCGLPVIASENRGHKELIINNKVGWVIDNLNPKEFSKKMKILALDQQLRLKMGDGGRNVILQRYSEKKVLEEQSIIYKFYMRELEDVIWAAP
jgi:glycosyltransferase EpsD